MCILNSYCFTIVKLMNYYVIQKAKPVDLTACFGKPTDIGTFLVIDCLLTCLSILIYGFAS